MRLGNVVTSFAIHVCSRAKPEVGAHPIERVNGESWRVLPQRYVLAFPHRIASLQPISCPIGDVLEDGRQLVLTNAPPHVSTELEQL